MTEHTITPERVFVVLGLFLSVRVCFTLFFSLGIMNVREASVTEKRIQVNLFVKKLSFFNVDHLELVAREADALMCGGVHWDYFGD